MLGKIVSYDEETQTGVVRVQRSVFDFHIDQWNLDEPPEEGGDVFVQIDSRKNKLLEVFSATEYLPKGDPVKSRIVAGLLGMFLGIFGAGRLYLGYYQIGIFQMAISIATLGFGILWPFVDGILILTGTIIKDAEGRPLK